MSVVLVATVHGLAGAAGALRAELGDLRDAARTRSGCSAYEVGEVVGAPADFLICATWADEAAVRAHYASAAYGRYSEQAGALLARPTDALLHQVASTVHPQGDASADPTRQD